MRLCDIMGREYRTGGGRAKGQFEEKLETVKKEGKNKGVEGTRSSPVVFGRGWNPIFNPHPKIQRWGVALMDIVIGRLTCCISESQYDAVVTVLG